VAETADVALGDVRSPDTLGDAVRGADAIVSAMTGFGPGAHGPKAIDYQGNLNLIRAAEADGVRRFVLVSMHGAAADHTMELVRMKHRAEQALRVSRLDWVILRPNVLMELWARIVGTPIVTKGKATVFGRGDNPINFNSAKDVARFIELALSQSELSRSVLEVGGPENVTLNQLVERVQQVTGRKAVARHVPLAMMRLSYLMMRPFKPDVAGMIQAGIAFDTVEMSFDASQLRRRFPRVELTKIDDVLVRQFATASSSAATAS
jgi:NADH dehydrogenase